ncbi:MAG TPA: ankyrin repeat domain-containing protein [Chthonomonadaceae bacterium]|nr:ankyrin repeat domain-containing protein [Chthonomonadaceae bacterium]
MATTTDAAQKRIIKAAKSGDAAAVRALLEADATLVGARDSDGSTPLHYAAWRGHPEVAAVLLDFGADIQAKNDNGHWGDSPLHAAAHGNQRAVAELLLDRGADMAALNPAGRTPLEETAVHKATAVANLLKQRGAVN